MKRILILGADGYIGWSLFNHLAKKGHSVVGLDNKNRRAEVQEMKSISAVPILSFEERAAFVISEYTDCSLVEENIINYSGLKECLRWFMPDTIVHLAEQPSGPFSMIDAGHAAYTHINNVIGTLNLLHAVKEIDPSIHIVKLGCYDNQTEVLTEKGWKFFKDISYNDKICSLNIDTEQILYDYPTDIMEDDYKGEMLEVKTKSINLMITPNHRTAIRRNAKNNSLEVHEAQNLPDINFSIPRSGIWEGQEKKYFTLPSCIVRKQWGHIDKREEKIIPMNLWLRFFGIWLADGCLCRDNKWPTKIRISVKKQRKIDFIKSLSNELDNYGLHATFLLKNNGMTEIEIADVQLATYLNQFGKAEDKYIPIELKAISKRQLVILYDSLINGDGHISQRGTEYYFSISDKLLGDVQEIAMKIGKAATLCSYSNNKDRLEKYLSIGHNVNTTISKNKRNWVGYKGKIYCCSVPTGIIMVRRHGRACWCGNSMGEYGTPNIDISEGDIELKHRGRSIKIPFPKQPGSFYHMTKLHDTNNIIFACRIWGLSCTDIMQGVVFGTKINALESNEALFTRFDFDECFGTVINRFCAQAVIGEAITPYGTGSQKRGFLPLKDSIQCLNLIIDNPARDGEYRVINQGVYRVINQFEKVYSINQLAQLVKEEAMLMGLDAKVKFINNPRIESEDHYYNPEHKILFDLGYVPAGDIKNDVMNMLLDLRLYTDRILKHKNVIAPKIEWDK